MDFRADSAWGRGNLRICATTHGIFCFAIERIRWAVLPTLQIRCFLPDFAGFVLVLRSLLLRHIAPFGCARFVGRFPEVLLGPKGAEPTRRLIFMRLSVAGMGFVG